MNAALVTAGLLVLLGCASAPVRPPPDASPLPVSQAGSVRLGLVHAASCAAADRGARCDDLAHWCVRADDRTFTDWNLLRAVLDATAKTAPEEGATESNFSSRVSVALDADREAPYSAVQRAIQLCGKVGLYRVECVGPPPPAGPKRRFQGANELRVAIYWNAERGEAEPMLVLDGRSIEDRDEIRAIVRGLAYASADMKDPPTLIVDAADSVPWGEVYDLVSIGRSANIEFATGRMWWCGGRPPVRGRASARCRWS